MIFGMGGSGNTYYNDGNVAYREGAKAQSAWLGWARTALEALLLLERFVAGHCPAARNTPDDGRVEARATT